MDQIIDTFKYNNENLQLHVLRYGNKNPGLLITSTEGEPYLTLTTNLPEAVKGLDYAVAINRDPFHLPIAELLARANVLIATGLVAHSGHNTYHIWTLCDEAIEVLNP